MGSLLEHAARIGANRCTGRALRREQSRAPEKAATKPAFSEIVCEVYALIARDQGCESGRRFSVGRSSSLGGAPGSEVFVLFVCSVFFLNVGLFAWLSTALRENIMLRSLAFTESNSEVVTMYSCFAGKIRAISFCAFSMRSALGGCVENTFGIVPGRRFSSA